MSDQEDEQAMMRVRGGDVEQLSILFERHHRRLHAFCLRMTGRPQAAEDAVQEVFCRILRYRQSYRPGLPFVPWMYRMARNSCLDLVKLRAREGSSIEGWDGASPEPHPEEQAGMRQDLQLLSRALGQLPDDRREILLLARFGGLDYRQIAATLDCTVTAVKIRVHRSLKQLREIYLELAKESTP
jgi:RNA polymerase sigma factor (sigma-70 family)